MLDDRHPSQHGDSKAKQYVIALAVLSIIIHGIWRVELHTLRQGYRLVVSPITRPLLWTRHWWMETSDKLSEVERLREEKHSLQEEVGRLRGKLEELEEVERQHARLSHLLDFTRSERRFNFKAAEVTGRPPSHLRRTLLLSVGTADGVCRDDPVIVPEGVLGRIVEVFKHSSRVLLLQDMQSSIGSMIQRNRASGDAQGTGKETLLIRNIPPESEVHDGDTVITSGMSTFYPKGLTIGKVVDVRSDAGQMTQDIVVRPSAAASKVEEVLVLRRQRLDIRSPEADRPGADRTDSPSASRTEE